VAVALEATAALALMVALATMGASVVAVELGARPEER